MSIDGIVQPRLALRGTERAQAPASFAAGLRTCRSSTRRGQRDGSARYRKGAGSTPQNVATDSERARASNPRPATPNADSARRMVVQVGWQMEFRSDVRVR